MEKERVMERRMENPDDAEEGVADVDVDVVADGLVAQSQEQ